MAMKRSSIKTEITAFIVALMIVVIGALSFFILRSQKESLTNEVELRGLSIAKNLAGSIADFLLTEDELSIAKIMSEAMNNKGVEYAVVVDDSGKIKAANNLELLGTTYTEPAAVEEIQAEPNRIIMFTGKQGKRTMDFAAPAIAKGKIKLGTIRLGISYAVIEDVLNQAYIKAGVISLAAIILGIIGAFILGAAITKPIGVLEKGAKTIGTGNLDFKIKVKSNNELGELAAIFNMMTQDLKKAQEAAVIQQRMERELEVAREIQLSLIPKDIAKIEGYKIDAYYKAAREVSGDYYDIIPLNKEKYGIVMGDVSGKGVPAALIMTMARSILHSEAQGSYDQPSSETLKKLNSVIAADIREGMFVTVFYGILDTKKGTINIASAGHNDTLVYRAKGAEIQPYNPKGFPLGADPGPRFDKIIKDETILLEHGDKLVIFTDGITEAMNEAKEEFGDARLLETIRTAGRKGGKEIVDAIIAGVAGFVKEAEQSDDIALVVLTRV
jgi:serine phosphatase RsbU (regulator of sigma subunit)